jgi:erythromycin esterase
MLMPLLSRRLAGLFVLTVSLASASRAQQPRNLGFEVADPRGLPLGWQVIASGYETVLDGTAPFAGRFSLRTRWVDTTRAPDPTRVAATIGEVALGVPAGARIRFSAYIRTENVNSGAARLLGFVRDAQDRPIVNVNGTISPARGTTPWTRYEVIIPVDSANRRVVFGVQHVGDGTAWFDSLSLEIVGGSRLPDVQEMIAAPRPAEDLSRLLSDAELALPPDNPRLAENPAYASWVRANAHPVRSLGANDFSDLRFLAPLLEKKRIVQLGESSHGAAEFSMAKVRLIKYLHEELGYDVMAFESGIYECDHAQRYIARLSAEQLMRQCIFGVWWVDEALPLFEYIKETQKTPRPLRLAGFDMQVMGGSGASRTRPEMFRLLIAPVDSSYARRVYEVDADFAYNFSPRYAAANERRLVPFYDSLAKFLGANAVAMRRSAGADSELVGLARQVALSMVVETRHVGAPAGQARMDPRDSAMADNLDFLLNARYPGKKVMVWAHNYHIQHREGTQAPLSMGRFVAQRHRAELYTIGLFMYRGVSAGNDRSPMVVAQSSAGNLESILHQAPWKYSFVDFSRATREPGSEWMWQPITGLSWGINPERFVPRDEYDGVLFIDRVHPPRYR